MDEVDDLLVEACISLDEAFKLLIPNDPDEKYSVGTKARAEISVRIKLAIEEIQNIRDLI